MDKEPWPQVRLAQLPAQVACLLGDPGRGRIAHQPARTYEGLATLCILAVLLLLRPRGVNSGLLGLTYLVLFPSASLDEALRG